jgi:hypothetical protein
VSLCGGAPAGARSEPRRPRGLILEYPESLESGQVFRNGLTRDGLVFASRVGSDYGGRGLGGDIAPMIG